MTDAGLFRISCILLGTGATNITYMVFIKCQQSMLWDDCVHPPPKKNSYVEALKPNVIYLEVGPLGGN